MVGAYDVQDEFILSRKMILCYLGLDLTLSEQVILRRFVQSSIDDLSSISSPRDKFQPAVEGAFRFFTIDYGVGSDLLGSLQGGYFDSSASQTLNFIQEKRLKFPF
ncbi:MAG: hypothetical protein AABW73_03900 [Nanoarchaeota archaeon]